MVDYVKAGRDGRRVAILGVMGVALSTMTACGSPPPVPHTTTSTTTRGVPNVTDSATRPLSATDAATRGAIGAYLGMWQDFARAGTTSDWQSPALPQYATGIALSDMSRGLYADKDNGLVTRGTATHNPKVSSMTPASDPTTVVVSDCSDSRNYLKYYASSGKPANDGPGGRQLINATVQKQPDGSWKVTDFGVQAVGTC